MVRERHSRFTVRAQASESANKRFKGCVFEITLLGRNVSKRVLDSTIIWLTSGFAEEALRNGGIPNFGGVQQIATARFFRQNESMVAILQIFENENWSFGDLSAGSLLKTTTLAKVGTLHSR